MDILNLTHQAWYNRLFEQRIKDYNEQAALRLKKISEETGTRAVLEVLDALDNLKTPAPSVEFIGGYSTFLYFSGLASPSHSRTEMNRVQ